MASQTSNAIDMVFDYNQQGLRLLELPLDVSNALFGPTPPSLKLKSAGQTVSGSASLALCTNDKTYEVKQVSSSNTLMLVKPCPSLASPEHLHRPSLVAFAKCSSILEALPLSPASSKIKTARAHLADMLPLYDQDVDGLEPATQSVPPNTIYSSIPYSKAETDTAWTELMAFEIAAGCFRPSVSTCIGLWSSLFTSTIAQDIDITGPLNLDELQSLVTDYPHTLLMSVLKPCVASQASHSEIQLDATNTVEIIAGWLLLRGTPGIRADECEDVLGQLRNLLPEQWRPLATSEIFQNLPDFKHRATSGSGSDKADAKRKTSSSRNWHDKFRKTKT